ncbi:MAG: hypothetical protein EOP06_22815, partial [Proteobacteria bacterium]
MLKGTFARMPMSQIKFDYEVEYLPATVPAKSGPQRTAPIVTSSDIGRFVPAHITNQGENASRRFLEFFAAEIENDNTRAAYYRAVCDFFHWCEGLGFHELTQIEPVVIAAYIKTEKERRGPNGVQSVKVSLAAIRRLFDYLVVGQVMPVNPALSVRGPKYVVTEGKTPVLSSEDAKLLIESIPTHRKDGEPDLVALRDRALIGLMVYSLARVSAALKMEVRDYRPDGKRFKIRLHEKGGKLHQVPVHHKAEEYLDEYIEAAGISDQARSPLWRKATSRAGKLDDKAMSRFAAFDMIQRRAEAAGINGDVCCHTFRATGITIYRKNGGKLE